MRGRYIVISQNNFVARIKKYRFPTRPTDGMVIDEECRQRTLPEFLRSSVDGIGNRCADRVNRFSEDTDDMSALHEGNPHLRDIIADGVIRSQGGCDQVDVAGSHGGLHLPPDHCVILRSIEILIESPGYFGAIILQPQGLRVRMKVHNPDIA